MRHQSYEVSSSTSAPSPKLGTPLRVGVVVSVLYVLLCFAYVGWNWGEMVKLHPNEVGDFLAGAFGPLALFWLVVGYFQQGEELRQNTEALRLQANELRSSVDQQQRMAEAAEAQVASMRDAELSLHTPRFVYHCVNNSPYDAQPNYLLRLKNEGADCQDVVANVRMPWGVTKSDTPSILYMESWEIPLPWHGQTPVEGPAEVNLRLVTRGRGRLRCGLKLRFVRENDGRLELVVDDFTSFTQG